MLKRLLIFSVLFLTSCHRSTSPTDMAALISINDSYTNAFINACKEKTAQNNFDYERKVASLKEQCRKDVLAELSKKDKLIYDYPHSAEYEAEIDKQVEERANKLAGARPTDVFPDPNVESDDPGIELFRKRLLKSSADLQAAQSNQ